MTSAELTPGTIEPKGIINTLADWRRAWLSMDENPAAIAFAATLHGKIVLHVGFIAALALSLQVSLSALVMITLTLGAIAIAPVHRLAIMVSASVFYFVLRPFQMEGWKELVALKAHALPAAVPALVWQASVAGLFLLFAAGFLAWQRRSMHLQAAKRPMLTLMVMWCILVFCAWASPSGTVLNTALWTFSAVFISSIWYLAYAAVDQKGKDPTPLVARAGWMRPFWGGSATPMGKSFGYLNKFDAKDDAELAATRLKAVKLAVWAVILVGICSLLHWGVYETLQVPMLQEAILSHANGENAGLITNWISLVTNYFFDLLVIAIWGHLIVATVRMVGYRIPRNTRNPLASRSLAEFWNRYFFYFKELLVDFFFYPVFVRYFKSSPKIRIAFATFCAAGLGNFLYHISRDTYLFAKFEAIEALMMFESLAFYCTALAVGLIISQWRSVKLSPEDGFWRYEVLPRLNVFAFFCFLKIFDTISTQLTLWERAQFTFSLFYP